MGFPGGSVGQEFACNAGEPGSIPGLGRSPADWTGYPLQYSGLQNFMDRGAWQATVHGVAKSRTRLSDFHFFSTGSTNIMIRMTSLSKTGNIKKTNSGSFYH